jgi:hypothetical protein
MSEIANPENVDKYYKSYIQMLDAKRRYCEKNRSILNERARNLYNENEEYKEKKRENMREYARKKREEEKKQKEIIKIN